ncbi:condensation domain-containing protein [Flexibacterium corallicola]|uniref:condensation domain-containing protein n=1 Tax=Flexibacterium corallicola TaxID=3037259 RepID=UPI00286FA53B|nr:condensation domain-containing protein [Pseudovibrio sp. M1P-2-3]
MVFGPDWIRGPVPPYHIEGAFLLNGRLELEALDQALCTLVCRHEALRTVFEAGEKRSALSSDQEVRETGILVLEDGHDVSGACTGLSVRDYWRRPFDLAAGPLFRVTLIRVASPHMCWWWAAITVWWMVGLWARTLCALPRSDDRGGGPFALPYGTIPRLCRSGNGRF